MRTIKLTIAYDGTDFHGWQIQPALPSIQQAMMDAVERVTGERVTVEASGRTDAGVHALGQVASFHNNATIPTPNLVKALNRQLPYSVRVLSAEDVRPGFHARYEARAKTYRYRIYRGEVCPPFFWRYAHHFPYPLDEQAMMAAAPLFEGEHDFESFASVGAQTTTTVRTIFLSQWARDGEEIIYTVRGSGFLHHMVRNIVGTLVEVGKGRMSAADIPEILAARRRAEAGPTLPAKGLWLVSVEYGSVD